MKQLSFSLTNQSAKKQTDWLYRRSCFRRLAESLDAKASGPRATTFQRELSATAEVGSLGHRLGEAVANGALSETVAGRLAVRYSNVDGTVPNIVTGGRIYSAMTGRPQSLYDVSYADYMNVPFRERTVQQEVRLSSAGNGPLTWTGGINLFHSRFTNDTWAVASPAAFNFQAQNRSQANQIRTTSAAVFGEGTLALTEQLKATLGLR